MKLFISMSSAKYKKNDRVVINLGNGEYTLATITRVSRTKKLWHLLFDDGDEGETDDIKDIVGLTGHKKHKSTFTIDKLNDYIINENIHLDKKVSKPNPIYTQNNEVPEFGQWIDDLRQIDTNIFASVLGRNRRTFERFKLSLDSMRRAFNEGQIVKADAKTIISNINSALSDALSEATLYAVRTNRAEMQNFYDDPLDKSSPYIHTLKGKLQKTKFKGHPKFNYIYEVALLFEPFIGLVEQLKGITVSVRDIQKEKREQKRQEVTRNLSTSAMKEVHKILTDLTEKMRDSVYDGILKEYNAHVRHLKKIGEAQITKAYKEGLKRSKVPINGFAFAYVAPYVGKREGGHYTFLNQSKIRMWVKSTSTRETNDILEQFIAKQTLKLTTVINAKENLSNIRITNWTSRATRIEGTLKLEFADKSSFYMTSQVVTAVSKMGKHFARYPTTFSNVTLPDGSTMTQPSENNINTVFARV